MKDVDEILNSLTLEEKAALCQGETFWNTKAIPEKGVPSIMLADGPHGLRKQTGETDHMGMNPSVPATCFPSGAAIANSWDKDLIFRIGQALGEECQQEDVAVLLGPGANMKRSPLCGRNFEYFSEDPYLSSHMAKHHILGVQSQGVGTSLKHFAVNNQETRRMTVDAKVDERTLREIYLASFETAVKEAKPWSIMAAYNKVNGEYCCENPHLLGDILRKEWGYDGVVLSDWGAANDQVTGIPFGFDLRMPYCGTKYRDILVEAVKSGKLQEKDLDQSVRRILTMIKKGVERHRDGVQYDVKKHHELAVQAAMESAVLLKNERGVLPLEQQKKTAVIGAFANHIRYQGGGSSNINPTTLNQILNVLDGEYPETAYEYAKGYRLKQDLVDEAYEKEALKCAGRAEQILYCMGLPYGWESEGFDRKTLQLPENQIRLLGKLKETGKPIVVLLFTGAPVEMPWLENADAILAMYTAGQGAAEAAIRLVYGAGNPCGKLAETYPKRLGHTPCALNYPQKEEAVYEEGIYTGYRYYEKKELDTLFDFGYGLSYTTWEYSNLSVEKPTFDAGKEETLTVTIQVKNTGTMAGKEIVELYIGKEKSEVSRAVKELKGFCKVYCEPGETKEIKFLLDKRSFSYYETKIGDWYAESGEYQIMVGASLKDIRQKISVTVQSEPLPKTFHKYSTSEEIMETEHGQKIMGEMMASLMPPQEEVIPSYRADADSEDDTEDVPMETEAMGAAMPLIKISDMTMGLFSEENMTEMIRKLNEKEN